MTRDDGRIRTMLALLDREHDRERITLQFLADRSERARRALEDETRKHFWSHEEQNAWSR